MNTIRVSKKQLKSIVENIVRQIPLTLNSYTGRFEYTLNESDLDELQGYHGSGADFNKFNHKKYLSTGAGSQSFGWGTYITDDIEIANGYAKNASETKAKDNETIPEFRYNGKPINCEEFTKIMGCPYELSQFIYQKMIHHQYDNLIQYLSDLSQENLELDCAEMNDNNQRKRRKILAAFNVINRVINEKIFEYGKFETSYIYEVEIPDDNGYNYIEWYEHLPKQFMYRILQGFLKLKPKYLQLICKNSYPFASHLGDYLQLREHPKFDAIINAIANEDDYHTFFASGLYSSRKEGDGKDVYKTLENYLGSQKAASLFLMQCGFDGIKYPTGTKWKKPDGAKEDGNNYVIFNSNNVKIVKKNTL